jgi:hypothetical protein
MNNRLINTKVAGGGGGCTDIVDNYDPFGGGVALYQLNGNANDVSGNYNGTASNVTYGTGVFGQAGVFNGSSSYVDLPNLGISGSQARTVSLWVKLNSIPPSSVDQLYSQGTNNNNEAFNIQTTTAGKIQVSYAGKEINSSTTLSLNTWYNVVVIYKGGAVETLSNTDIYINGIQETVVDGGGVATGIANTINSDYSLGYRRNISTLFYDGSIDQVRFFNTALTPLEVEALYTEELCICDGTVDTLDILGDGSCIATYQFFLQPQNRWYHLCVTYDRVSAKIYIDGSYVNQISDTTDLSLVDAISMGANPYADQQYYVGEIDQVRIFNKALNSSEVTTLYNETACTKVTRTAGATQILGDSSCIAYYKLDGTADDETGTYNGTFTNPNYGNGEFDFAGVFNGSSSWIANSPNIGFGQSISMWFDVNSGISVGNLGLWSQSVNGGLVWAGANVSWNGSNFYFSMFIRNSAYRYQSAGIISVNAGWNHIVFTFDNNAGYSAWLNNSELTMTDSLVSGTVSSFPSGTTTIGRQWGNNDDYYFNGSIDQIRIFNKAISPSEVTTLYNEGI